jgi:hypothetical protein
MNTSNPYEPPKTESRSSPVAEQPRGLRWYHYALRRLPMSLLITFVTLCVFPLLVWLALWIAKAVVAGFYFGF